MTAKLTAADLAALEAQDHVTLANWCNILNCWEWPEGLPDPEAPRYNATASRRSAIMDWIHEKVGGKLISRLWNDDMTDQEHEDFWNGTHNHDPEARKRYDAMVEKRVEEIIRKRREALAKSQGKPPAQCPDCNVPLKTFSTPTLDCPKCGKKYSADAEDWKR